MCFFQTKTPSEMNEILHKSYNDLLMKRINCEMMSLKDDLCKKLDALQPESDDDQQESDDDDQIITEMNEIRRKIPRKSRKIIEDDVDFVNDYSKYYLTPIIEFFKIHHQFSHWKEIFDFVAEKLEERFNICPISGKMISRKDFENRIVGCLTEHSSDSRQHYFRNGLLQPEGWRRNLFNNKTLRSSNDACNWEPYNFVRGKTWRLGPGAERPSQKVLEDAAKLYKVKGRRQRKEERV